MGRDIRAVPSGTAFVLVLHAHLPWSLRRGAWPHGSDWLGEAVCEAYLPLADALDALARDGVPVRWTLGITPILAQQLTASDAPAVLRAYAAQRLAAAAATRDDPARPAAERAAAAWWHDHYAHCIARLEALGWDATRAFAPHVAAGRVELMGSAATHAVLPLLATDESVRLQLHLGRLAHARTFGTAPAGCWLPECAYRPRGWWQPAPWAPSPRVRDGIDAFVRAAGFAWTVVDAHLPRPVEAVTRAAAPAPVAAAPAPTRRRDARTGASVLAAWAREIAAARAAGLLPPAATTHPAPAPPPVPDAGIEGDDRAPRPRREPPRTPARGAAWRTASPDAGTSAALALAQAIFADGVPSSRPWPVFEDLDALLRAARSADAAIHEDVPRTSGAFPLDSGAMWESGAFPRDSGAMWESGAFSRDSGAMWESGAFPRDSGAMWERGAFPFDSGVFAAARDGGDARPFDAASPSIPDLAVTETAPARAPIPFFDDLDGRSLASGAAPAVPAALEGDAALAAEFARVAAAPASQVRVVAAPQAASHTDGLPAMPLPPSWPHGVHQWRGPFVGPGATSAAAWRDAVRAVVPAVAHRPWRIVDTLAEAVPVAGLDVLVRDPLSARLVWSRDAGYPASAEYLEFHRRDAAHGLRLWRVTSHAHALADKDAYDPADAAAAADRHAAHFVASLRGLADGGARAVVAPFDAELFGHWWREGPRFLEAAMRALATAPLAAARASDVLGGDAPAPAVLDAGSWGALGSFAMWLNERTAAYWRRAWALETRFWRTVRPTLALPAWHPVLVQAARDLVLAQASDWPFMLTRDEAADHAARRAGEHLDACEALVAALERADAATAPVPTLDVLATAARQGERDDCFDAADVLAALRLALGDAPAPPDDGARALASPPPVVADATGDARPFAPPAAA